MSSETETGSLLAEPPRSTPLDGYMLGDGAWLCLRRADEVSDRGVLHRWALHGAGLLRTLQ